tara:strand:- start:102609 stop:104807 length:2199 start_codon:yes stop_codon:yes gene_type:complete
MVLTVVGTVLGGPIGGAIGAVVGNVIDNQVLFAPKGRQGPRLSDLRLQTSRYGDQIPHLFGTMRVAGTVIWATDLQERRKKKKGGKGQPSVTTYSYGASFAVALSTRRIAQVGRIWADGNLLRGAAGDFKTAVGAFRLHDGSEDQALDPLIAAHKGMSVTPAHRGIAYAVFEDMQLADYGNRIPSLTFEVIAESGAVPVSAIAAALSEGAISAEGVGAVPAVSGYAASGSSLADALSPLVDGLGIALRTDASGLRLAMGSESEASVAADLVGAAFNGKAENGLRLTRGRAEDVPVRLSLRYYDAGRDYQAGVQTAQRPGPGRREGTLDLPAMLDAGEARSLAETRLQSLWSGRNVLELRCDWRALTLEPGAVVSVAGQTGRWRIEQSEWEGIGVRLRMRQVGGAGVAAPAASAGDGVAQADLAHGATSLLVADLPVPGDDMPSAPVVVAATAGVEPGWRSAEIFVEDVATGGLTSLGGSAAPATIGTVSTLPVAAASAGLFNMASVVEIDLLHDGMILAGADDMALLGGANRALLGREIIQFGMAVQTGAATWQLRRLLRGRRGTEWAMAAHSIGERFVLLEEESLLSVPSEHVHISATLTLDAIGIGDLVPVQAEEMALGQAVLPLSPVHVRGSFADGDWRFDWIRRSRAGWRWNDGADAPLGEEQELYRIALSQGGATFRSAETAVAHWTYDAASIAADIGAGISGAVSVEIRQIGTYGAGHPTAMDITL